MNRAALVCTAALATAGCGGGGGQARAPITPTATTTAPRATATATATAPPTRSVHFEATDSEPVSARYTPAGKGAPVLVLLHEIRARALQWDALTADFHQAGYATLAYDSRTSPNERERVRDTLGAVRWLRARGYKRIGLVGASIGASTAVLAMSRDERLEHAGLLQQPDAVAGVRGAQRA